MSPVMRPPVHLLRQFSVKQDLHLLMHHIIATLKVWSYSSAMRPNMRSAPYVIPVTGFTLSGLNLIFFSFGGRRVQHRVRSCHMTYHAR